jgi:hypothetical protein
LTSIVSILSDDVCNAILCVAIDRDRVLDGIAIGQRYCGLASRPLDIFSLPKRILIYQLNHVRPLSVALELSLVLCIEAHTPQCL